MHFTIYQDSPERVTRQLVNVLDLCTGEDARRCLDFRHRAEGFYQMHAHNKFTQIQEAKKASQCTSSIASTCLGTLGLQYEPSIPSEPQEASHYLPGHGR